MARTGGSVPEKAKEDHEEMSEPLNPWPETTLSLIRKEGVWGCVLYTFVTVAALWSGV